MIFIPDISMCLSDNCPMRDSCYRVQAKPGQYQSWCNFEYTCNEDNGFCDYIKLNKEN